MKKVERSIYEWGAKEMQTMSEWIDRNYPGLGKYISDYPDTSMKVINPSDYELEELGHFKTFREQALPFWKELLR